MCTHCNCKGQTERVESKQAGFLDLCRSCLWMYANFDWLK